MKVGIIGLGNMGKSLFNLLVKNGFKMNVVLSDLDEKKLTDGQFKSSVKDNIKYSDIVFICVKPNDMKNILKHFKKSDNKTIVSCAAGVTIDEIQEKTDSDVIRMMANLPIEHLSGSISYFSKAKSDEKFLKLCKGPKIIKLENEKLLDVTTLLAGSMPAFSAYLAEEYINFGISKGLTEKESLDLYISSVEGTLIMMKELSSRDIIDKVSSPKGITMRGIQYLDYSNVKKNIKGSLDFCLENISKLKN